MNLGIVLDSAAGITKEQAEKRKWYFLPLHFFIDEKDYKDGVDITKKEFYEKINSYSSIKTSASYLGETNKVIEKASKEHDHVIVYTISKHLSSQNKNILAQGTKYKNVHIIDSKAIGPTIINALEKAERMNKENETIENILEEVNKHNDANFGFLIPKTLEWLVKGGRISPKIANMAKLLKIVPIIIFQDGKLERFGRGRIFDKVVLKVSKEAKKMVQANTNEYQWFIMHSKNSEVDKTIKKIETTLEVKINKIFLPPIIGSHVGPGAICIFLVKK